MGDFIGLVHQYKGFENDSELKGAEYECNRKKYSICYEGEIYNSDEIRDELLELGYGFETYLEEEIVLKAYIEWTEKALNKFVGVFSIAIWEEDSKTLFLARDQIGAKALYYSILKEHIIFSDEIKNILKNNEIKSEVTYEGICEILLLGPSKRPDSAVFRNINELEPGHFAFYYDGKIKTEKYWDFLCKKHTDDFEETAEKVRDMLTESVIKCADTDLRICTLLSGGLDSSIVTTIIAELYREFGKKLTTISVDYEGNDEYFISNDFQPNADAPWIIRMSEYLDTEHINVKITSESLLENLELAMLARDLPGMADIDASLLLFCKEIKKYADIGLGGECADEIFGGYPWFHREELMKGRFFPWISSLDERINFLNDEVKFNINAKEFAMGIYDGELNKVQKYGDEKEDKMREIGILTYKWFLPTLLIRQDKMSKYGGINIRAPFCNCKLMEYVFNIPWEMRSYNGREKGLLRYAFKDILPKDIIERKKSPYPKTCNPVYTKIVSDEIKHIIQNPTSPIHEIINVKKVEELINTAGDLNVKPWYGQLMRGPQIMAFLIQVNMWMKKYNINII